MKAKNEIREWWERIVRVLVVGVLLFSAGAQAGYKPVDISGIQGEKRKRLVQAAKEISGFPKPAREAFLCEQLGLCFKKDGSRAMCRIGRSTEFRTFAGSWHVTGSGKIAPWGGWWKSAGHMTNEMWHHALMQWVFFPRDYLLSFYPKEVEKLVLNTAKYLLRSMPKEHRWMVLASIGDMLYNDKAPREHSREDWEIDNAVPIKIIGGEGRGYFFLDPEGGEHEVNALVGSLVYYGVIDPKSRDRVIRSSIVGGETGGNYWRWRWTVWRCENLVGAKDILALFPEEVKAMRKHFKERKARLKDEAKAKNDALLVTADETMSSLPREKRLARIALAIGLYYLDHKEAGFTDGHLNPKTTIILPDGTKYSVEELGGETPGLLQQIPHEAILEFYRQPIEQMARALAKERFKEMPPMLRDLLRAQLSRKLVKLDGSPARIEESISTVQTFDRTWQVPMDAVDYQYTYSKNSGGQSIPYSLYDTYAGEYMQTFKLVNLCARILGKEETVKLIPSGDEAVLTAEQQRAWLAEKMGFCFTEDGAPAYQSERIANRNAVYVDAQGKVRKLAEVKLAEVSGKWTERKEAALAVGYDKFTAPYKEELKQLALQTSKHILASMPPGLRHSWLAEQNRFFFIPNAQLPYDLGDYTPESGIRFVYRGTFWDYAKCLYHDPSGKIVPSSAVEKSWDKRWRILYHCESYVGIDAINALFPAEVESMRAAFQKSPFYEK